MIIFMKNFTIAGGMLMLYVHGLDAISVDAKLATGESYVKQERSRARANRAGLAPNEL
jgi:hypothetical protein